MPGAALDIRPWIAQLREVVDAHALGEPGAYARMRGSSDIDPYGCADAANILFTLGEFPRDFDTRTGFIEALCGMQNPATGYWRESTHHEIHTTAHCLGALELFDAGPKHALTALAHLEKPGAIERFLDGLAWVDDPWHASHQGAGVYAARVLAREASPEFETRYFTWLARECDPASGMWRRDCATSPFPWGDSRFPHLAGTFHYLFNHEHARQPHPYPTALVDTCLDIFENKEWHLALSVGFAEVDWVYCLSRALAQSGQRYADAMAALERFAAMYVEFLLALDWERDSARDLHTLFGALCCLAELQRVLPGRIDAGRPLRLVLDRRPFI